jgi:hypothetical protein
MYVIYQYDFSVPTICIYWMQVHENLTFEYIEIVGTTIKCCLMMAHVAKTCSSSRKLMYSLRTF